MTLRELIEKHPEFADIDVVVYNGNEGEYSYIDGSGTVYIDEQDDYDSCPNVPVLVFSAN